MEVKDKDSLMVAIGVYLFGECMKRENGHLTGQDVLDQFKKELTLDKLRELLDNNPYPRKLGRPCSICQDDPCCCLA